MLGGITFVGSLILIVGGIYLAQFYDPHPAETHQSVGHIHIITVVPLGDVVDLVHFWTAQIVTVTLMLRMLRGQNHSSL